MRVSGVIGIALVTSLLIAGKGWASGIDLHWLWDNQCADCHGHSGDFVREFLKVNNGQLEGSHRTRNLDAFMRNHYASNIEVDAIYQMLLAQALTRPRFKQECSHCHDGAASFIRHSLVLQDDVLLSRQSGQPVREYLLQHRQLGANDVDFYMGLLNRVAREVYRP